MSDSPEKKRTLVVGASQGISSLVPTLEAAGHAVFVADPFAKGEEGNQEDSSRTYIDLADREHVFGVIEQALAQLGGLDTFLFTAANDMGVADENEDLGGVLSIEHWSDVSQRLIHGGFYCTQAVLRHMVRARAGRMIYVCADRMVDGNGRDPAMSAASCSLLALSSSIAASAFRNGVTVNALLPGVPYDGLEEPATPPEHREELVYAQNAKLLYQRERAIYELEAHAGLGWAKSVVAFIRHLESGESALVNGSVFRLANVGRVPPLLRWTY